MIDHGLFSVVRVGPQFGPALYAKMSEVLQAPPRSGRLLDLASARFVSPDVFERLVVAWTARRYAIPRLGILLKFESWVWLRNLALAALQPIAARGIRVGVFYEGQGDHLGSWFSGGEVVHDVAAAVAAVAARWRPSSISPFVLDELARLVHAYSRTDDLSRLLTDLGQLNLSCIRANRAEELAREVLYHLPPAPSQARRRALRLRADALIAQGNSEAGVLVLQQERAMTRLLDAQETRRDTPRARRAAPRDEGGVIRVAVPPMATINGHATERPGDA
ncbi:MAG TPA: hypothetical protein VHT91_16950 [Kofleriaceae bacterium]|nr:hypothetical protein [Kofleriaceae bacterium]